MTFNSNRDGNWEIYVINSDGSSQVRLTDNNFEDWDPSWQLLYLTTVNQVGIESDYMGDILKLDGKTYTVEELPVTESWVLDSSHSYSWISPITVSDDKRYVLKPSSIISGEITVTDKDEIFTARYTAQYYVDFSDSQGGSISESNSWYSSSEEVVVSATPLAGFRFTGWSVTGGYSVSDVNSEETMLSIDGLGSIHANYDLITLSIFASAETGGSIAPSGKVELKYGEDQDFNIIPEDGYSVSDVLVDGDSFGAIDSYSFISVETNHTITVSFVPEESGGSNGIPGYSIISIILGLCSYIALTYRPHRETLINQ